MRVATYPTSSRPAICWMRACVRVFFFFFFFFLFQLDWHQQQKLYADISLRLHGPSYGTLHRVVHSSTVLIFP